MSQEPGRPHRVNVRPRVRQYRDDAQAPDEIRYYQKVVIEVQYAFTDGRVSSTQAEVDDPVQQSLAIKDYARSLGADLVGISHVNPAFVFEESHIAHKYAISLGMEMDYEKINTTPEMPARVEVWRVYAALGEVSVLLAAHIRSLGYPAQAHHPAGSGDLLHIPFAVQSGLGELGRNGCLITPQFGPRLRLATVSTNLPLAVDRPIDLGINAFCDVCQRCLRRCPGRAIGRERRTVRGVHKYVVDLDKCLPVFAQPTGCSVCIKVCHYNRPS
jgi:epoxyqueuosine reductase